MEEACLLPVMAKHVQGHEAEACSGEMIQWQCKESSRPPSASQACVGHAVTADRPPRGARKPFIGPIAAAPLSRALPRKHIGVEKFIPMVLHVKEIGRKNLKQNLWLALRLPFRSPWEGSWRLELGRPAPPLGWKARPLGHGLQLPKSYSFWGG